MKAKGLLLALALVLAAAVLVVPTYAQISGQYIEVRTADVYTGPCFANSEVNLAGHKAVLAWRIEKGSWSNVGLDGMSVVAVVRASATLGDPYANPFPAKAVIIVDDRASQAQRAALVSFAQAQAGGLLSDIVAIEASPIRFVVDEGGRHGYATLEAGNLAKISTRAISEADLLCHNEEVYYPPLAAHLNHSMPAVAAESTYRGNYLGVNWTESGRRGAFIGTFSF
jgi:hypothetical protein